MIRRVIILSFFIVVFACNENEIGHDYKEPAIVDLFYKQSISKNPGGFTLPYFVFYIEGLPNEILNTEPERLNEIEVKVNLNDSISGNYYFLARVLSDYSYSEYKIPKKDKKLGVIVVVSDYVKIKEVEINKIEILKEVEIKFDYSDYKYKIGSIYSIKNR